MSINFPYAASDDPNLNISSDDDDANLLDNLFLKTGRARQDMRLMNKPTLNTNQIGQDPNQEAFQIIQNYPIKHSNRDANASESPE